MKMMLLMILTLIPVSTLASADDSDDSQRVIATARAEARYMECSVNVYESRPGEQDLERLQIDFTQVDLLKPESTVTLALTEYLRNQADGPWIKSVKNVRYRVKSWSYRELFSPPNGENSLRVEFSEFDPATGLPLQYHDSDYGQGANGFALNSDASSGFGLAQTKPAQITMTPLTQLRGGPHVFDNCYFYKVLGAPSENKNPPDQTPAGETHPSQPF
jgi:hypothetical protein